MGASSVQALAVRVSRLAASGAPITGNAGTYVTNKFTKFSFTPEYEDGEEIQTKAADGSVCVYYKAADVLKSVSFTIDICEPNPDLYEMMAGGSVFTTGLDSLGWAAPTLGTVVNPNGISVEVWTRAIENGRPATTLPYFHWVMPYGLSRLDGERAMENGAMAHGFSGTASGNTGWGDGPGNDWTRTTAAPIQFDRKSTYPTGEGFIVVT